MSNHVSDAKMLRQIHLVKLAYARHLMTASEALDSVINITGATCTGDERTTVEKQIERCWLYLVVPEMRAN